jgi:hypothetical protein
MVVRAAAAVYQRTPPLIFHTSQVIGLWPAASLRDARPGTMYCRHGIESCFKMSDDPHGHLIDLLTEALQRAGREGVTKQDVLPAVADFLASLALITAGEAGMRAVITRLEGRIDDWKAGRFPASDRPITH